MKIHQIIKDAITSHAKKIELTQWAIIASISSLIYSEYLIRMKQKQFPKKMIMIAPIRSVNRLLMEDGPMMTSLSTSMIDGMVNHDLFKKYADAPELVMFKPENIEIMKTIFDLYILQNVMRRVPEAIARKFNLMDEKNQMFFEDTSIDLFDGKPFNDDQLNYIIEQVVLQLLILLPSMKKEIEYPEQNTSIHMCDDEILTIANDNALGAIHFNPTIFNMGRIMNVLSFVTNTKVEANDWSVNSIIKNDASRPVSHIISTGLFNSVALTRLIGIEVTSDKEGEGA